MFHQSQEEKKREQAKAQWLPFKWTMAGTYIGFSAGFLLSLLTYRTNGRLLISMSTAGFFAGLNVGTSEKEMITNSLSSRNKM